MDNSKNSAARMKASGKPPSVKKLSGLERELNSLKKDAINSKSYQGFGKRPNTGFENPNTGSENKKKGSGKKVFGKKGFGKKGSGKNGEQTGPLRFRRTQKENILGITKPAIRRLARRGGVKRMSALVYDQARNTIRDKLTTVLEKAIVYTEAARRRTVSLPDIKHGLAVIGQKIYI